MKKLLTVLFLFTATSSAHAGLEFKSITRLCSAHAFTQSECESLSGNVINQILAANHLSYGSEGPAVAISFRPWPAGERMGIFTLSGGGVTCTVPLMHDGYDPSTGSYNGDFVFASGYQEQCFASKKAPAGRRPHR